jgi:hypothetical protein
VTYNLPAYPSDDSELEYHFLVMDTDGITIKPNGSTIIRSGASSTTPTTGTMTSTVIGSYLILKSISGVWIAETATGTWTLT